MSVIEPPERFPVHTIDALLSSKSHNSVLHNDISPPTVVARSVHSPERPLMSPSPGLAHGLPGPVPLADFVVFGGTGDLAVRKLLPALYLRDRDGQLPAETRIVALSRAGLDVAGYRDKIRGELPRFVRPDELDRRGPRALRRPPVPRQHRHRARGRLVHAGRVARRPRSGAGLLPRHRAQALRAGQPPALRARPGHTELPPGAGEADRHRPGLGPRDQRRRRRGLRGEPDLPDRPLPRQGERPEPARDALRQQLPRAAVERQRHRPRADHRGGVARCRHARRLLRRIGRPARHDPEPPAPAALPGGDGASDVRRPRDRPRREAQGAPGAQADHRDRRRQRRRGRAVPSPAWSTAGPRRRTRPTRSGPARPPRPSSPSRRRCRTGGGPACRSTCAPASGWRAGSRRS